MSRQLLLSLLLALVFSGCKRGAASVTDAGVEQRSNRVELSPEGFRNAGIEVAQVDRSRFAPRLIVPASIDPDPRSVARVGARAAGRVARIHVRLGDTVKAGQPLAEVETVEIHKVSSEFLVSRARTREARDALERQRLLVKERVGATQDLRRAEAEAAAAEATYRESEEHLHFLGLSDGEIAALRSGAAQLPERSIVRAPIDGRVASVSAVIGQVLTGPEDLVTIVNSDKLWATLRISEGDLGAVEPGTPASLRVPGQADRAFEAVVEVVSDLVDPSTRTAEARARIVDGGTTLRPGMTAIATLTLRPSEDVLWLPAEAVQSRGAQRIAFVRVGERTFEPRLLVTGPERSGFVPVAGGLDAGVEVVIRGAFALRGELDRAELEGD